jgi:hypothetical protein
MLGPGHRRRTGCVIAVPLTLILLPWQADHVKVTDPVFESLRPRRSSDRFAAADQDEG